MPKIHATAIVDSGAELAADVEVGPYCIIGPNVKIGAGTKLRSHVCLEGWTTIGESCEIYQFASLGAPTQDLKYNGAKTFVEIGDRNTIRESVTINASTEEGEVTKLGNDNFLMAYCHMGHKCLVGNHVTMANGVQLAGHVVVEDHVGIGGLIGVHQFVRIGTMSFTGACSKLGQDIPPYFLVQGNPAASRGLNVVGMQRGGVSDESIRTLKKAYRLIVRSGLSTTKALERIASELDSCPELDHLVDFVQSSERGITR